MNNNLCVVCNDKPIHNRKRKLCIGCYLKLRRLGVICVNGNKARPVQSLKKVRKPVPKQYNHRRRSPTPFTPKFIDSVSKKCMLTLLNKYGIDIFNDFDKLRDSHVMTLQTLGDKYGVTRERIRQIYKHMFGHSYTQDFKKLVNIRNSTEELSCANDPRIKLAEAKGKRNYDKAVGELAVFNKCIELGFDVNISCNKGMIINNKKVGVKVNSSHAYGYNDSRNNGNGCKHYHFSITDIDKHEYDLMILYIMIKNLFYIIPKNVFNRYRFIYIREGISKIGGKRIKPIFSEYMEAWNQLN